MGLKIFNNLTWHNITREERVFCAELEFHIRKDPQDFIKLLETDANLPPGMKGPWDTAFEACFYRDFLHKFDRNEKAKYSPKRTFDIALFSDHTFIIIEAKVAEKFTADQAKYFDEDIDAIKRLFDGKIKVYLIALASQTYFDNYKRINRGTALNPFNSRHLSWQAINKHYPKVPLFERACEVYERKPLKNTAAKGMV